MATATSCGNICGHAIHDYNNDLFRLTDNLRTFKFQQLTFTVSIYLECVPKIVEK